MRIILLIMIGLSILDADFTRNAAGVVSDGVTGLEWQDNKLGSKTSWEKAIDRCEALDLDGKSDWRLPNMNELDSTLDDTRTTVPLASTVFKVTMGDDLSFYQSSTTFEHAYGESWGMTYGTGYHKPLSKSANYYVRCVRGGH